MLEFVTSFHRLSRCNAESAWFLRLLPNQYLLGRQSREPPRSAKPTNRFSTASHCETTNQQTRFADITSVFTPRLVDPVTTAEMQRIPCAPHSASLITTLPTNASQPVSYIIRKRVRSGRDGEDWHAGSAQIVASSEPTVHYPLVFETT